MDELPPTTFVLRPHHLEILKAFTVAFQELREQKFPSQYMLHLYRVLMQEVAEVEEPRTHEELIDEFKSGPSVDSRVPEFMIERLEHIHADLQTYDDLWAFMKRIPWFVLGNKADGENPLFARRSLFGYFIRRCFVSFVKLSFGGIVRLLEDYHAWYDGDKTAGYQYDPKNDRDAVNHDTVIFKTAVDKQSFGDPAAYAEWEKSMATGDEALAVDNISRYFEQRFTDVRDSKNRQYLLLHVIRMHYLRHEYGAVRKLLQEAISVCRTNGDKIALQHCTAILHRLPPIERGQKPIMNTIQHELHPLEILYDVKKLMQVQNEQPLTASFEKIVQFLAWYDHWIDINGNIPIEREHCGHHAVQSIVWSMAGCNQLSSIEENIVTALTEVGGDSDNRIAVTLNRAYKRARQGDYDQALCMLLEPDIWRSLTLDNYVAWAGEVWHILVLRASRRGQDRLFREFLKPRRPAGSFSPKEYFFDANTTHLSIIRDPLYEVIQMRASNQGSVVVDKLLVALWHAEFQCRYGLYRSGIILLADIGLEFGMTKKSRRMLEEIMPQIINGDELEQRALACFTLSRCIISTGYDRTTGAQSPESLQEVLPYLHTAESDYLRMEMYQSAKHVQYLISVVYHNLGMARERDAAAKRHFDTAEKHEQTSGAGADKQLVDIFSLISEVGVGLAGR